MSDAFSLTGNTLFGLGKWWRLGRVCRRYDMMRITPQKSNHYVIWSQTTGSHAVPWICLTTLASALNNRSS